MQLKSLNYTLLSQSEVESPDDLRSRKRSNLYRRGAIWGLVGLLCLGILIGVAVGRTRSDHDYDLGSAPACPQYSPIKARSEARAKFEQDLTADLSSDDFLDASVKRLQGAVQIPTESYDDMKLVGDDPRWEIFADFHEYLEKTFPLVFSKLEITKLNTYGLLITWKGADDGLKPYLFMAHQDVVPVPEATVSRWKYPPYSAHYDGRYIWGRGSTDCKNNLIGILEAFEALLKKDYSPKRTILASFGFDEEISGWHGAAYIAKHLEEQWGRKKIDLIIDEGGLGIRDLYGAKFALPALGEKGYLDVAITVETAGGHSSKPKDHTSIGYLAQIISAIEAGPYSPDLTPVNHEAYFTALQCGAEYGTSMDSWLRGKLNKALKSKDAAKEAAVYLAEEDLKQRYLLQTSQAVDLISGGVKINALPEKVRAVVNHRIAVESNVNDVRTHLATLIKEKILCKHDLSLDAWGSVSGNTSSSAFGQIFLEDFDEPLEPSPVSPYTTDAYMVFSGTIKQVLGEEIIVAPTLMTGNTDTKFYWNLTENIYRFSAVREGGRANAHTVDERMGMNEHVEGVKFYAQMILNGDGE